MEVDVPPAQIEAETEFVLGVHPRVIGAIANARPERNDFPAQLERLKALGNVRGIRRLLQGQPPELAEDEMFLENLRRLPDAPAHLRHLREEPRARGGGRADPCVSRCAVHPRSLRECEDRRGRVGAVGGVHYAHREIPQRRLQGLGHSRECEGRLDGGADQAVRRTHHHKLWMGPRGVGLGPSGREAARDPHEWVNATREIIAGASEDEQARLLHRNAERIYGVGK